MSNYTIFNLENNNNGNFYENINIDELFDKKKEHSLREYSLFKKLLNKIHIKIKLTSRQKLNEQFVWFIVPEIIIGYPKYDISTCIIFLIDNLKKNNFLVKYYHPNSLFIYWGHYCASYIRDEIKNKYGIKINEFGKQIRDNNEEDSFEHPQLVDAPLLDIDMNSTKRKTTTKKKKEYNDVKKYNPTGNFIYNEMLSNL